MNAQSFNIAILPDQKITNLAVGMSKKIASAVEVEFILDGKNLYPHITIYQAHYPLKNLDQLKTIVKKISRAVSFKQFDLNLFVAYGTFVFWWNCIDDRSLRVLHDKTVTLANPLREGLIMPQLADRQATSAEDKYDIKNFGSLLIGPHYIPHITLTRTKNAEDAEKVFKIIGQNKQVSFKPHSIVLGYLGDHGTVTGIIEEFLFS